MSTFHYLNINPYRRRTGDCVIRATAYALGISWEEASDLLYRTARALGCEMSCLGCYSTLFEDLRLKELKVENQTVEELAEQYSQNTLLVRIKGHLTCAKNSRVVDIWDCRQEKVDRAWLVE